MNLRKRLSVLTVLMLVSAVSLHGARPFPQTVYDSTHHRSIFIFSDQLHSNLSQSEARFAATHYIGTQKMPLADINRIRSFNESFLHLHYKLGVTVDSIVDYGMIINGNWFSENRSPLSNWGQVRIHADWFLLNRQGQWTVHGGRRMVMDISNTGFREWWVNSCIQEMTGNSCDGVFADTYTVPALYGNTTYPELFGNSTATTLADWIPKLNDYGAYVYTRLDSAGFYFFPNIDNLQTTWADSRCHFWTGDSIHGAMMESWGNWASSTDAMQGIQQAVTIQHNGKFIHGEGYFGDGSHQLNPDLSDPERRMWLAGTYLLCNQGHMALSMYGTDWKGLGMSGNPLWFPEYEIDLGPFKSTWTAMTISQLLWNGVLKRDYEKGFVVVNISSSNISLNLGGTFWLAEDPLTTSQYWSDENGVEKVSLAWREVTSLTMKPFTAAVLLNQEPGCTIEPKGDFDGSGSLDVRDVIALLRSIASGAQDACLDYNEDGRWNILDVVALLLKIV